MSVLKRRITSLFLGGIAAVCLFFAVGSDVLFAESIVDSNGMFTDASGVSVLADAEAPEKFASYDGGTIERDFDEGLKGVSLSADTIGSEVSLVPVFEGDFELTFRAYSQTSYHAATEMDYNSSAVDMTPYADLREISFQFTDDNGNQFTVAIDAGEKYNIITPAARVNIAGTSVGYHYATDAKIPSETGLKNSEGYFTRIGGTTFCNVARRGGAYTSENSMPVTFGYNSAEKEIYVMHYGTSNSETAYRVVYDLDAEDSGLLAIENFGKYSVKIIFTDIAEGKTANVVLYSLNGQSLAGKTFSDNCGAETIVSAEYNAYVGKKYYLPEPYAFDVLDGKTDFEGKIGVNGSKAYKVYDGNGSPVTEYVDGCYFIPDTAGEYSITYTALDKAGNYGIEKSIKIKAIAQPETEFRIESNYNGMQGQTVGKGAMLKIAAATVTSEIFADGRSEVAEAELLLNGELYRDCRFLAETTYEIVLEDEGEYQLVYYVQGFRELNREISFSVSDESPVYTLSEEIPARVAVGSEFTIPVLTAVLNGENKRGSATLYAPSGKIQPVENGKALIEEIGEYKIIYYVRFASTYTYTVYFEAAHSRNELFVAEDTSVQIEQGDSGSLYPGKAEGMVITFTAEEKAAQYVNLIDLSKNTKNDPLISIMVLPATVGKLDYWQYTVRLTDVNDPKNYVNISVFKGSWGNAFSYVKAGGAEQMPSGWEKGVVLSAYNTGCPVNYSFTGESLAGTEYLTLYYDYSENAIYVDNIKREGYFYGNQVIDLDSLQCFSENSLFKGFSTGEVYLSLSVQYLQSDSAKLLVKEVNGVSMEEEWIDDYTAPKIGVNFGEYLESDLPKGEAGVAYPVFPADAFDGVDGKVEVSIKVFKDYQTASQKEYTVIGNSFLPDCSGTYTILYSASDKSKNIAEYTVRIQIVDKLDEFTYSFAVPLETKYFLGERFVLPKGTASGGSGTVNVEIALKDPFGEEVQIYDFLFEKEGTYVLEIVFEDYLGRQKLLTYDIEASISEAPVVYDVNLHSVMLSGYTYVLPDFFATDYSAGTVTEPQKKIEVVYGGKVITLENDRVFVPQVENNGDMITVRYIAQNAGGKSTVKSYDVVVLKPSDAENTIDMSKYFALKGISEVNKTAEYVEYVTESAGAELIFANVLVANNLSMEIYVPAAYNNFSGFTVTFADSKDKTISLSASIIKNSSSSSTSWFECGNGNFEIFGNFYDKTTYGFSFSYNNNSFYFTDNNANKPMDKVLFTDGGEVFNGFPSGKVYFSIRFDGVEGKSALRIVQVGNQYFSDMTADRVAPQLQLIGFIINTANINEPLVVPAAVAADVLNPQTELTLTIKKGSSVIYNGAIDETYRFVPEEYGEYSFVYEAVSGGRSRTVTYLSTVKDHIPPEMYLNGEVPLTADMGKSVELPSASATDNHTQNMRIWIFITEPNGKMYALDQYVFEFVPQYSGEYLVSYFVEDEYGNYAYKKCGIQVS